MRILFKYLDQHRNLVLLALVLAAVNQIFSLLDPLIFRLSTELMYPMIGMVAK